MKPSDIFGLKETTSINLQHLMEDYWHIAMSLADEHGAFYSLVDLQPEEERKCATCGHICETDGFGRVPYACENEKCQMLRHYWNIHGEVTRFSGFGSSKNPRTSYLRIRIKNLGYKKLSEIPEEIRFDFLLTAMIERVAYEHRKDN